jgi:hypothetical protein
MLLFTHCESYVINGYVRQMAATSSALVQLTCAQLTPVDLVVSRRNMSPEMEGGDITAKESAPETKYY